MQSLNVKRDNNKKGGFCDFEDWNIQWGVFGLLIVGIESVGVIWYWGLGVMVDVLFLLGIYIDYQGLFVDFWIKSYCQIMY